ncbi:MAG: sulfatase [Thermogemmata sp.]
MRRDKSWGWSLYAAVILCGYACYPLAAAEGQLGGRPNIIILLADDLRADALGCMGNPIIQTPSIDALAQKGTLFRNAFVTTSICAVSRASILCGQYARRHGIHDFNTDFTAQALAQTYPLLLKKAGYRIGFIGKYGVGRNLPAQEFDYWRGFPGQGFYFAKEKVGTPQHLTARMGDQALEFLAGCKPEQPFCLSISFKAPHAQDGAVREFPPDPRDEKLYADAVIPRPATAEERFFRLLPSFVQKSEGRRRWERRFATDAMFQQTVKDYYRLITGMDREIGRIVDAVARRGWERQTLWLFTSDNGFFLGERGMSDKWLMYEESIRVPLIIMDPRLPSQLRGRKVDAMALNIDIAPTILDWAGVPVPQSMQGKSLRPWVEGQNVSSWRRDFFYEHHTLPKLIPPSEGVRTERWSYIRWLAQEPVIEELYDIQADPRQERNLAGRAEYRATLEELRLRWSQLRQELE